MPNVLVNDKALSDIAEAIREKSGSDETYMPAEMAPAIQGLSSGASTASEVSFDDTTAGLNADNVQSAIEALADDQVGSQEVQDMIEENLTDALPAAWLIERNAALLDYTNLAGYVMGAQVVKKSADVQDYLDQGYIVYTTGNVTATIKLDYPNVAFTYSGGQLTKEQDVSSITFNSKTCLLKINNGVYLKGGSTWTDCLKGFSLMQKGGILKYSNKTSGLTATTVQGAIDELAARESGGGLSEEEVNALIDTKLAAITDFTEVSF